MENYYCEFYIFGTFAGHFMCPMNFNVIPFQKKRRSLSCCLFPSYFVDFFVLYFLILGAIDWWYIWNFFKFFSHQSALNRLEKLLLTRIAIENHRRNLTLVKKICSWNCHNIFVPMFSRCFEDLSCFYPYITDQWASCVLQKRTCMGIKGCKSIYEGMII